MVQRCSNRSTTFERKGLRDKNISQHHSFELWFDEEKLKFYMHAADESAANKFRRRVANSYSNTQVFRVEGGDAFPQIHPDDYIAGAELDLNRHYYYPIRNHQGDGFERDPYGEVTSEMLSTPETRVVVQVVFRPAKNDWTEGEWWDSSLGVRVWTTSPRGFDRTRLLGG